jgi:hypothetical protein
MPLILPDPPTAAPLAEAQTDALVRWVHAKGYERKRVQSRFEEADFLAGAMTVFYALGMQAEIPAGWVFGPLISRDVLTKEQAEWALGLEPGAPETPEEPAP